MNIQSKINEIRDQEARSQKAWDRMRADHEREYSESKERFKKECLPKFRPADSKEYSRWLTGYMKNGGTPTHCYNYNTTNFRFYVALSDFEIVPAYGAASYSIIVPKGIQATGEDMGHCQVYFMDDYTNRGGMVPLFADFEELDSDQSNLLPAKSIWTRLCSHSK